MFTMFFMLLSSIAARAEICPQLTPAARAWILETAQVKTLGEVRTLRFTPDAQSQPHEAYLCQLEQLRTLRLDAVTDLNRAARLADLPPRLETLILSTPDLAHLCTAHQGCPLAGLLIKRLHLKAPALTELPAGAFPIGLRELTLVGDRGRRVTLAEARGLSELLSLRTLRLDGFETARYPYAPGFAAR